MGEAYTIAPLSPIRKIIAARMSEAKGTIPHFRLSADVEVDDLCALRNELNERNPGGIPSLNDFLIKACASALMEQSSVNVQWGEGAIHRYHTADISIVIALEDGVATPIIRSAESKTIWEISREVRLLRTRAAKNALRMDEIIGGSFSISNLGMYGVDQFDAVVNPPQCAILAIGAARPRVVASLEQQTRVAKILRATLSADHRAIDGATGAAFLSAFRRCVEQPRCLIPV